MSDEIDIVSRVGGAILLAETEWTPKASVSKERAMALAAIEAMREPTDSMRIPSYFPDVDWPKRQEIYTAMIDAALMGKALEGKK